MEKIKSYEEFKLLLGMEFQSPFEEWHAIPCILAWKVTYVEYLFCLNLFSAEDYSLELIASSGFNRGDFNNLADIITLQGIVTDNSEGKIQKNLKINLRGIALFYLLLSEPASIGAAAKYSSQAHTVLTELTMNVMPDFLTLITRPDKPFGEEEIAVANVREVYNVNGISGQALLDAEAHAREGVILQKYFDSSEMIDISWKVKDRTQEAVLSLFVILDDDFSILSKFPFISTTHVEEILGELSLASYAKGYWTNTFKLRVLSAHSFLLILDWVSRNGLAMKEVTELKIPVSLIKTDICDRLTSTFPKTFLEKLHATSDDQIKAFLTRV